MPLLLPGYPAWPKAQIWIEKPPIPILSGVSWLPGIPAAE
jgi:hypothetical protein